MKCYEIRYMSKSCVNLTHDFTLKRAQLFENSITIYHNNKSFRRPQHKHGDLFNPGVPILYLGGVGGRVLLPI